MIDFFKRPHQQSTFYTCGPAVVTMVSEYYKMLATTSSSQFGEINNTLFTLDNELELAKLFETTEAEGTDAEMMAKKLKYLGCYVDYQQIKPGKNGKIVSFPNKLKQVIAHGIPVIVNYTYHLKEKDHNNNHLTVGHFAVIYHIDNHELFISDPAAHFDISIKKEKMSVTEFLDDWKSGTGIVGIYLVIFPNEQTYKKFK